MFHLIVGLLILPSALSHERPNVLLISVDDLRPQFGRSFATPEVKTPNLDKFFIDGGGSAMQHSYVQIAVCGPSRASMLTGRRPDTTQVGVAYSGASVTSHWCWCQRTGCKKDDLFMTLPTYLRQNGYITAGNGKLFHPEACNGFPPGASYGFTHAEGDDPRAWSYDYYTEGNGNFSQQQWGSIPGPVMPYFNMTMGLSFMASNLSDEEETDGMLATNAVERFANFSRDGIGKPGSGKPFFHSVGFHKPHLPHIVPKKYFDMYDLENVSLPPNPRVPTGFKEENWHDNGNFEMEDFNNAGPEFKKEGFGFNHPISDQFARAMRRGYFAAVSFIDAQIGRVLDALELYGFKENTIVLLWGDHGWHLGDTNSWCKMTNFETAARTTTMWKVPGQSRASQGLNKRMVEIVDLFPTLLDLTGLPRLPKCAGLDQPPSVQCLQGESYASEFGLPGMSDIAPKKYAFTQWPYAKWGNETRFRMGYTVRSSSGYRYTEYVPYNRTTFKGTWTAVSEDPELYDYNNDYWETTNFALNPAYDEVVKELKAVLRQQYEPSTLSFV